MAKKNFKTDLGLLLDNIHQENDGEIRVLEEPKAKKSDEWYLWLENKVQRQERELLKWRTGVLTMERFEQSLKEFQLKYNSETNTFEKIVE